MNHQLRNVADPVTTRNQVHARRIHELSVAIRAEVATIYALLSERVSGVRLVRYSANEEAELATLDERIDAHRGLSCSNTRANARLGDQATLINGLSIAPGTTVGLFGASDAGKSTLIGLIPRLYDLRPGDGTIRFDGQDVRSLRLADRRRAVALVPQQAILFEGTIRTNLLYAAPSATADQIRWALRASDLATTVDALTLGLETPVGERGYSLSGGQRQRLPLARALLAEPSLLLLGDCTSALDAETEERIHELLRTRSPRRTCLIVSHTVASIRWADRIYVLESGKIVEAGTHAELLGLQGRYAAAYRQQIQAPLF